jgi:hydroxymethylbilane synthase
VAVDAERTFLAELGGGCDLPVGAYATVDADGVI